MDWKGEYLRRQTTAKQAVGEIRPGQRVVLGHACGEPQALIEALVEQAERFSGVEIVHMVAMGSCGYAKPEMESHFRHNAIFAGPKTRRAIEQDRADFTPGFFFEVPQLLRTTLKPDVALVMVSPPDEEGVCSLGVSVDYTLEAIRSADYVVAQVNRLMPRTCGQSGVHVSEINRFVLDDRPMTTLTPCDVGPVERAIGEHCARLIRDGDTLQLGIGAIPDAVLQSLQDKRDLGIHSEMFSDGVVNLIEQGVVTNAKKTLHPGICVATFLMGTRRLYDFVDQNRAVALFPVDYVNHPMIAAQNDNLVSINSCVQVDLMGQICSEAIGNRQISGVGGQVDFVRAAALSRGGRSIIAMPASTKGISKIVPLLDAGAPVTTSRTDVDYVVTEYGVAHLKGASLRQRAQRLCAIAHPDFRPQLFEEARRRFPTL